jgi:hypothetical protein
MMTHSPPFLLYWIKERKSLRKKNSNILNPRLRNTGRIQNKADEGKNHLPSGLNLAVKDLCTTELIARE